MTGERAARAALALILAAFVTLGVLYAVYTPPWQAPDEPAHYNYVAQVAGAGCCPVIEAGDWDAAYLRRLTTEQFPEAADLSPLEYEDHQPPLYYLLGAAVFGLSGGSLLALRLMSVALGAGVVLSVYLAVARVFPAREPLALAAAAFAAFIPQHISVLASVNNDALAELVLGVLVVLAAAYLGNPVAPRPGDGALRARAGRPHPALLGLLAGLAFLTKLTVYAPAVLVTGLAITFRALGERRGFRWFAGQAAWAAGVALALGALWWGRNAVVYGWPDIFAQAAHEAAVVGQLRTSELIEQVGPGGYLRQLAATTYHSFFGQFGWMAVPLSPRVYRLIALFLLFDGAGLGALALTRRREPRLHAAQRAMLLTLGALAVAAFVQYAYYNLTFVQFQGRYLYPALIPFALLAAAGLWGWARLLAGRLPAHLRPAALWLPPLAMLWLALLSIYALFRVLVPNLG